MAFEVCDSLAASISDADTFCVATAVMEAIGVASGGAGLPMRAAEDFGEFGGNAKAALLCLGPDEGYAALHNPDCDFPDDLPPIGSAIFDGIAGDLLASAS